ncbi:MAG TPA: SpoIIE family protein phosphatase, partial [Bacteroidota bacterium]|nr:SpoIIE family protein phosphatase [Bacteroidota bacterium]
MKTILLVEDDPIILRGLKDNLERNGFRVLSERDGRKGFTVAMKSNPDLAILDVMLPTMNGFDICSSLKQSGCTFPIFLLTGLAAEAQRLQGLQHGADDYITKPFSVQEVVLRVKNALGRSEQLGRRGKQMDQDLRRAREIQLRSLPQKDPDVPVLEIHGQMVPALQVGGDYFDYLPLSGNKFAVIVADVSGKGMPAALYVQKMQGIVQSSKDRFSTAKEILVHLQNHLGMSVEPSSFITAVAAVFDIEKSVVEIVRAGHLPVLMRRGKRIREIKPPGLWLGKSHAQSFDLVMQPATMEFKSGDVFLFYTDGIVESSNSRGAEFGLARLKRLVSKNNGTARKVVSRFFNAVEAFVGRSPV